MPPFFEIETVSYANSHNLPFCQVYESHLVTNYHRRCLAAFLLDSGFFSFFSTHDQPRGKNKQTSINMEVVLILLIVFFYIMLTSLSQARFWRLGELGVQVERSCLGRKSSCSQVCFFIYNLVFLVFVLIRPSPRK